MAAQVVRFSVEHDGRPLRVPDVVEGISLPRRTLDARLRQAGWPPAEAHIGWVRILHAAWRSDLPMRTQERVARELGFSSVSALGNLYRRYAGLSPTAVWVRGGFPFLLALFLEQLKRISREWGTAGNLTGSVHGDRLHHVQVKAFAPQQ